MNEPTFETTEGPTPNGGVKSIIYFRAANGDPTTKAKAAQAEIVEFDAQGNVIQRTYGTINPKED